jgi:predicted site-specific integrase-resolvase
VKLSTWAKQQGIHYSTAWRWWRDGKLPVPAYQTATGAVFVRVEPAPGASEAGVALYARVSSSDQKTDLEAQLGRLAVYAAACGMKVVRTAAEVGSGLNGHRPKLMKLLADPAVTAVVVEHRDRLMRFGAEYVEAALAATGRRLIVVEPDEVKDDLVQDMIEVLTSFCARLYGRRSAKNKAKKALDAIHGEG